MSKARVRGARDNQRAHGVKIKAYKSKIKVGCFGGCGQNTGRYITGVYPPLFDLGIFNTDKKTLASQFFSPEPPPTESAAQEVSSQVGLENWRKSERLTLHALGEKETFGRGAGANPDIGLKAAQAEDSKAVIVEFYNEGDVNFICTGLGGGTGTGAVQAAVDFQVDDLTKPYADGRPRHPPIGIFCMPLLEEKRTGRASEMLEKLRKKIPVFVIQNDAVDEYLKRSTIPEEERRLMTREQKWSTINELTIRPLIRITRAILHDTWNVVHIDEADWHTLFSYGNFPVLGFVEMSVDDAKTKPAAEIVEELTQARCQVTQLRESAEIVMLCVKGPLPDSTHKEVSNLLREKVGIRSVKKIENNEDIEFIEGIDNNPDPQTGTVWISLITVSKGFPVQNKEAERAEEKRGKERNQLDESRRLREETARLRELARRSHVPVEGSAEVRAFLYFKDNLTGVPYTQSVPKWAADEFQKFQNIDCKLKPTKKEDKEKIDKVVEAIYAATGHTPRLPERLRTEVEDEPKSKFFRVPKWSKQSVAWFQKKAAEVQTPVVPVMPEESKQEGS